MAATVNVEGDSFAEIREYYLLGFKSALERAGKLLPSCCAHENMSERQHSYENSERCKIVANCFSELIHRKIN